MSLLNSTPHGSHARRHPRSPGRARASAVSSHDDTVVAIATPVVPSAGGVAVVRLSGPRAVAVATAVFRPGPPRAPSRRAWGCESHVAVYGHVVDPERGGALVDEVLALPMLAPRSYTRQDVVELHCHGGSVCVQRVLGLCLRQGARLAPPGEFTLRAFLNGRLDLAQAEGVHALVAAATEEGADSALGALQGGLGAPCARVRSACLDLLCELDARIDFDDELPPLDTDAVAARAEALCLTLADVLRSARRGCLLATGVTVAIVGRPNVGKSSLLNTWSRSERAIVTAVPGTTRDIVEARLSVAGVPVTLLDTAGVRSGADDEAEVVGMRRSVAAAAGADVLLMVVDARTGWTPHDEAAHEQLHAAGVRSRPALLALNKTDCLAPGTSPPALDARVRARFAAVVPTSALRGEGIALLEGALAGALGAGTAPVEGAAWAATQRQAEALQLAADALSRLGDAVRDGLPTDCWAVELREAAAALGAVTGDDVGDDLLATIFARFCIGK